MGLLDFKALLAHRVIPVLLEQTDFRVPTVLMAWMEPTELMAQMVSMASMAQMVRQVSTVRTELTVLMAPTVRTVRQERMEHQA